MDKVDILDNRVKDLELKMAAVLESLQLECEHTPEKYTLVQPQTESEDE